MIVLDTILSILALSLAITVIVQSVWIHRLRHDLTKAFEILDSLLYGSTEHEGSRDE